MPNDIRLRPRRPNATGGVIFLLVFGLFWCALVGTFDFVAGRDFVRQFASQKYLVTTGQITRSVVTSYTHKGTTYGVDIRYRYVIDDRAYDGTRFRYSQGSSSDSAWARAAVAAHPVGSAATVYYNPRDPQDALLSPGLNGSDLMWVLFLTPFNLVALFLLFSVGERLRRMVFHPVAGGVKIARRGFCTRVRMPTYTALAMGGMTVGAVAFAGIFLVAFSSGFHPSMQFVGAVIAVAYGSGLVVYLRQWWEIHSGDDDLIIDESLRRLELPKTFQRKQRVLVDFADISEIAVETHLHTSSKGQVSYTYAPTLRLRHSDASTQKLAEWSDAQKADSFADWLRGRVEL